MTRERLVYLVDADAGIAVRLRDVLAAARLPLAAAHPTPEALLSSERAVPDVVVLDCGATGGEPAPAVRILLARWPDVCVVVTGGTPSMLSHAVTAGARGFLLKPYEPSELVDVLHEAIDGALTAAQPVRTIGKLVAVYGPKGGAGCSTVAVGTAVLLAGRPGLSVALVDLDLQFGDVGVLLDVRSPNSVRDLVGHDIDAALVDETFVRHETGLRVLPAPAAIGLSDPGDGETIARALDALRRHFSVVVCDLAPVLDDVAIRTLRAADCVVLVTKPELTALKSLSRVLNMKDLALDEHALVVANRLPSRGSLTESEVERSLGRPIAVSIPSDGAAIVDAANRGIAVVDSRIRTRAHRAYQDLAAAVARELDLEPRPAAASRLVEVA